MNPKTKGIWISRPQKRALPLAKALQQHNLVPHIKPAMCIGNIVTGQSLQTFLQSPQTFDLAIFVSEEAVQRLQKKLRKLPPNCFFKSSDSSPIAALAIGDATKTALSKLPIFDVQNEIGGDSQTILNLPYLNPTAIAGKQIAVFGGESEKPDSLSPTLCTTLRQRKATVSAIALYRRLPPHADDSMEKLAATDMLHAAISYSGDTAAYMLAMTAPNNHWLLQLPLFVIHPHIAAAAKKMGYQNIQLAAADSGEMAASIADYLQKQR